MRADQIGAVVNGRLLGAAVAIVACCAACSNSDDPPGGAAPSLAADKVAPCERIGKAQQALADDDTATAARELEWAWHLGRSVSDKEFVDRLAPPGTIDPSDMKAVGEAIDALARECGLPER